MQGDFRHRHRGIGPGDTFPDRPDGFDSAHFLYHGNYDRSSQWEDVTDPGVHGAVYERYAPSNVR